MSNRARRAHTHALRRRLLPDTPDTTPKVTLLLRFDGGRRPYYRQLNGSEAHLTRQPDRAAL